MLFFLALSCFTFYSDDARANARKVLVCRDGGFKELQWRDVKVGDVLKVPGGEEIPADLVFLAASCEDPDQRGVCHVQTAQLDGETNLKMRNALDKTVSIITDDAAACSFKGKVVCEEPHENFAKFNGSLYLEANAKRAYGLDANATLLRGCVVKNVTAVYGVAVYTGRETKVRVKQSATTAKKASVEAEINRYIVALVVTQVILCVIATIGYAVWNKTYGMSAWYLSMPAISAGDVIARFFTFFLLISNIIPISLYVTMKLAREFMRNGNSMATFFSCLWFSSLFPLFCFPPLFLFPLPACRHGAGFLHEQRHPVRLHGQGPGREVQRRGGHLPPASEEPRFERRAGPDLAHLQRQDGHSDVQLHELPQAERQRRRVRPRVDSHRHGAQAATGSRDGRARASDEGAGQQAA